MPQDIFVRVHAALNGKQPPTAPTPRWPEWVLVFDTETTLDTSQDLVLGAFRRCRLVGTRYVCAEEGLIRPDDIGAGEARVFETFVNQTRPEIGVKTFPPKLTLPVFSRSEFVEKRLWWAVRKGEMVVCFNLPFDLSRLAVGWRPSRDGGWSLILSRRRSHLTGKLDPNPERPCIRVTARTSKAAFVSITAPQHPEEWPKEGRFLDLHSLASALYDDSFSLESLCEHLKVPGKLKHRPTGRICEEELRYCRQDVRATVGALNGLKAEFDRHPVALNPDSAASPASFAKAYFDQMGIVPPREKFTVSDRMLGIAMQAYYGGRAECRIRQTEVPVIHTDFKSQYATVNTLLGNWAVLTAAGLTFEDATENVRALLSSLTLPAMFNPAIWKQLSFFALVRPNDDIFPVRSIYNGSTPNIGSTILKSAEPIWFAGPDVVASFLLTGNVPHVERAIRMVPHGQQGGLRRITLRGMVAIDPRSEDFFRHVVEQKERVSQSDEALSLFLKTLASAGSYGLFVEVNPKPARGKRRRITIYTGEKAYCVQPPIIERPGRWYFPPIASLITAGGRLLLAMLERCVTDRGGSYLFCDTDSLCIVAAEKRGWVKCRGGAARRLKG